MTCTTCGGDITEQDARITDPDGKCYHPECYPSPSSP